MDFIKKKYISFLMAAKTFGGNFTFEQNDVSWTTLIGLIVIHALALMTFTFHSEIKTTTMIFGWFVGILSGLGITAGAHRLWAHRSYKAKAPLQLFLIFCNTLALEKSVIHWSRDHRVHHKFTETDADPHNAKRGFFFAHMGWLMLKKHPDVTNKGKTVDISDLEKNIILKFQHEYYPWLILILSIGLPTLIPVLLWQEQIMISFLFVVVLRVVLVYHSTWLVNSAAHLFGNRPYDKSINPRENLWVSWLTLGEGFHNYHHTFPWDYSTSEFGIKLNPTTLFINIMAKFGQAYDLKKVKDKEIRKRAMRTGDDSCNSDISSNKDL